MFDLIQRENMIFEILSELREQKLRFIMVGGYAISAYKHRFSIDADIIIKKEDFKKYELVLVQKKLHKTIIKELDHVYAPEFIRYETREKPAVSVDVLIDGIGSRTTKASFSFEQIEQHSQLRKIIGTEREVLALVPDKEILIALKIHSGRLTDFRDIAAVCQHVNITSIKKIIKRGDLKIVKENIHKLLLLLDQKDFIDNFKGVFQEKRDDIDVAEIRRMKELLD